MASFTVVRSTSVDAEPAAIYPHLADFHEWTKWNPWEDSETEMTREYSGPPSGPGAGYSWVVAENGGSGTMTIVDATAPTSGEVHIEFLTPTKGIFDLTFHLVPQGTATELTWTLIGQHTLLTRAAKATGLLDKLAGNELDRGLQQLKSAVETGA